MVASSKAVGVRWTRSWHAALPEAAPSGRTTSDRYLAPGSPCSLAMPATEQTAPFAPATAQAEVALRQAACVAGGRRHRFCANVTTIGELERLRMARAAEHGCDDRDDSTQGAP